MSENILSIFIVVMATIMLGFFAVLFWMMVNNRIDLTHLVSEPGDGKASLSRFQLLLFTFVIAGLFFVLSLKHGTFVDIPQGVQILLGISGGSFLVSKAIGTKKEGES